MKEMSLNKAQPKILGADIEDCLLERFYEQSLVLPNVLDRKGTKIMPCSLEIRNSSGMHLPNLRRAFLD